MDVVANTIPFDFNLMFCGGRSDRLVAPWRYGSFELELVSGKIRINFCRRLMSHNKRFTIIGPYITMKVGSLAGEHSLRDSHL